MPIYEYECPVCGRFELIQSASEKPTKNCPQCAEKGKKTKIERMVSPAAFHLKGSGWYKTDYSSGAGASGASKSTEKKEPAASESSSTPASSGTSDKPTPKSGCGGGSCSCH